MKLKFQRFLFICLVAGALFSCSTGEEKPVVDMDKLKTEIQAMEDAYAKAENDKDAAAVAVYYSDDAITYGRNEEPTIGKEAITARIARRLANDTTGTTNVYKIVDLFVEGNTAVEIGSWTEISPSGEETGKGHYMSYFENRGGKWQCVRDMSVSSNPVKAPM